MKHGGRAQAAAAGFGLTRDERKTTNPYSLRRRSSHRREGLTSIVALQPDMEIVALLNPAADALRIFRRPFPTLRSSIFVSATTTGFELIRKSLHSHLCPHIVSLPWR